MDKFIVQNSSLRGTVSISGSKNAALPMMAASLLTDKTCEFHRVPDLMDIRTMGRILEVLGKKVEFRAKKLVIRPGSGALRSSGLAPYQLVRTMRASFCCLGPLLAKNKKAKVALPGGCAIGVRPVDLHLKGLRELNARIEVQKGYCFGDGSQLKGARIYLGGPFGSSVLATANVLMAAVLARGRTVIEYAACEPEIKALAEVLKKMGARLEGAGTPRIEIEGVRTLCGVVHEVPPDRIEAGTFIAAALGTKSSIELQGVDASHLTSVTEVVKTMGGALQFRDDRCRVRAPRTLRPVNITTLPYPGFPTDLQAQFTVCLTLAKGISLITEKIYPDRFMHVQELNRMDAKIQRTGPYAIIEGRRRLYGAEVMASDLRASAALVIAGLAAEGTTEILRVYHIDRGYEHIERKLRKLGAKIRRIK
ncbi:MAG: UDP-N-acetylglucosamine 1-carboxyvinyltransferase [Candidatus Omnitrophica bacterium]|nr:UDP-N-acetylglucosamine 1-carboxyvinyltransferase [Candidatus Omnitrophota bacterium]